MKSIRSAVIAALLTLSMTAAQAYEYQPTCETIMLVQGYNKVTDALAAVYKALSTANVPTESRAFLHVFAAKCWLFQAEEYSGSNPSVTKSYLDLARKHTETAQNLSPDPANETLMANIERKAREIKS